MQLTIIYRNLQGFACSAPAAREFSKLILIWNVDVKCRKSKQQRKFQFFMEPLEKTYDCRHFGCGRNGLSDLDFNENEEEMC